MSEVRLASGRSWDHLFSPPRLITAGLALMTAAGIALVAIPEQQRQDEAPAFLQWYDEASSPEGDYDVSHFGPGESGGLDQAGLPASAEGVWKLSAQDNYADGDIFIREEVRVATIGAYEDSDDDVCLTAFIDTASDGATTSGVDIGAYEGAFESVRVDVSEYGGIAIVCAPPGTKITILETLAA